MTSSLKDIEKANAILKDYNGDNPFILRTRNTVFGYRIRAINDFECEYILKNYDKKPIELNKIAAVADWYGESLQNEWKTEFIPKKLKVTWFIGETSGVLHFYCIYRRSQEKAVEVFAPKKGVLTNLFDEEWKNNYVDFEKYNKISKRELYPYQEEAVKFLLAKKRCILASEMGSGKTMAAIVAALEGKYKRIFIICPASVKDTWKREITLFEDEDNVTIVNGSNWNVNKFTIVNYDILKNFYTVPTEVVKEKELTLSEDGDLSYVEKQKTKVSRKKALVDKAMAESDIFNSKFDLLIIDEAHRLSNTSSGIFKIVSDMVKRCKMSSIYALTGTPITNHPINFYNILKIIDAPIAKDWKYYVERYCDGKHFFKKGQRDAYTAMFLKSHGKQSWYDLTMQEKRELDVFLQRKCKTIWVTNGASHLDELQEIVKPYYLRRLKSDFGKVVKKTVKVLNYELSEEEKESYDKVWDEYKKSQSSEDGKLDKHKKLIEGSILRQWLATAMTSKTISLVRKCIEKGHKVVVFCSYDAELDTIVDAFKECCVYHNGKLSSNEKTKSVDRFQNDPNIKVFVGNIQSAGVGITLVSGDVAVFNSFSWVSGDNLQAEDRIHRLNQTKDVTVYYQVFKDTFYKDMFEKVRGKQDVINDIIVSENEK